MSPLERALTPRPLGPLLGRMRRGTGDPTHRRVGDTWWRAANTPSGPVLLAVRGTAVEVRGYAWGAGAAWALDQLPELLGDADEVGGFRPEHPLLAEAWRRNPWLRVGRTGLVVESLVPAVIEQKVTGAEAFRAQRLLVRRFGTPAPGPAQEASAAAYGMWCPPTAEQWAAVPSWAWLKAGVEQKRSRAAVGAARRGPALERTLGRSDADSALRSLPGIGAWTSAEVRQRAHGDPDAWSTGDYHVPGMITLALAGEKLDNDAAEELLEPYRGHRYRVQQLVELAGIRPERHGPRRTLPTHLPS
ncbi:DNA-3-methyladenine glycosylase family protein [Enemella dayhoffiae]|uniref:DNA-3-methyladenine glycosylase family protein n=1 Tax=Enemella dayhoffiae TaxID=2016507 RepID=UPI001E45E4C3|nr:DNA-3-methyladenine glycosylase 2 family protein [Enemella dayhoffiae]